MSCEHFLEIPRFDDEISSARITMNLDQWKRKKVNCDRCLRSIAANCDQIKHSALDRMLGHAKPDRALESNWFFRNLIVEE
jgi:hypothetical protein